MEAVPTEKQHDVQDVRHNLNREKCKMAMMEGVTPKVTLGAYMFPDVFRYKNEWYLDVWATERGSSDLNAGNLHVFKHKDGKTTELCEFTFRKNAR